MAGVAGSVGGGNILAVRRPQLLSRVAGCAGPAGGVVISVAVTAPAGGRSRRETDRLGVALDAAERSVHRMSKFHRAAARCAVPDRDADRQRQRLKALPGTVAGCTIGLLRPLMMTDLAPSWPLEGEAAMLGSGGVTGNAGQAPVPRMGKGVRRCRREGRRQDGWGEVRRRDIPLSPHRLFQPAVVGRSGTQRAGGVEGERRPQPK